MRYVEAPAPVEVPQDLAGVRNLTPAPPTRAREQARQPCGKFPQCRATHARAGAGTQDLAGVRNLTPEAPAPVEVPDGVTVRYVLAGDLQQNGELRERPTLSVWDDRGNCGFADGHDAAALRRALADLTARPRRLGTPA